jgi:ribosomal protein S18 acetylase RimI-like enzyme
MKFAIERATVRDTEEVGHLLDLYRQFYGQPADHAAAKAFLRARLERDESVVFVARDNAGRAIGFAQLYPLFCSVALKRQWLLYDLYVLPEARRTGAARALLERCRELGIQTGSHALFLETAHNNTAAQHLYETAGWHREAQFVKYNLWL